MTSFIASSAAKIMMETMKGCKIVESLMSIPAIDTNSSTLLQCKGDNQSESDGYHSDHSGDDVESDEQK